MAKRAGSEDEDAKIKTRSGAPKEGHNNGPETTKQAAREILSAQKKVKLANEELKTLRKQWKARGIELKILDSITRMADWTRGEIRAFFDTEKQYAAALGLPTGQDRTLFDSTPESVIAEIEWHAAGKTAGFLGKPCVPPEECPEEYHQEWLKGYHEGDNDAWDDAEPVKKPAKSKASKAKAPEEEPSESGGDDGPEFDEVDGEDESGAFDPAPVLN